MQLSYDAKNRGRAAVPELAGAMAMGGVAASMALAASLPLAFAGALWLGALCRSMPAILYALVVRDDRRGVLDDRAARDRRRGVRERPSHPVAAHADDPRRVRSLRLSYGPQF